ncbi:MAG: PKD domain-containing protein [Candidatus Thermoplasmatota archaeon]|nr:PKD domain-containing protein [Candidatus Thermoplasmatota archaeon]
MKKKSVLTVIGVVAAVLILVIVAFIAVPWIVGIVDSFRGSEGGGDNDNGTTDKPNIPPIARLTVDSEFAREGDMVTFDGNGSYDEDYTGNLSANGILSYIWNWGDGTKPESTENATVVHVFNTQGKYTVTLTVYDEDNARDNASVLITIVPRDTQISSSTQVLIGEPLIPGVRIISNTTEVNWTVKKNAKYMEIDISVGGFYAQEISTNTVEVLLYNPYEKLMANETVQVLGSKVVSWNFTEDDISVPGEYYVFVHCTKGAAFITVQGLVAYVEE